jgi:hypothetical protein
MDVSVETPNDEDGSILFYANMIRDVYNRINEDDYCPPQSILKYFYKIIFYLYILGEGETSEILAKKELIKAYAKKLSKTISVKPDAIPVLPHPEILKTFTAEEKNLYFMASAYIMVNYTKRVDEISMFFEIIFMNFIL